MGVYFVSVDADDWANEALLAPVRVGLNAALTARGLPPYAGPPSEVVVPGDEGDHFEEKLSRDHYGFFDLCRRRFDGSTLADIGYWSMIVPVTFDDLITLATPSAYDAAATTVGSAFRMRDGMTDLAEVLALPASVPRRSDNLDITGWFDDVEAGDVPAPGGAWRDDLDCSFYVAMYLRAAEFSIKRSCPMRYV